MPQPQRFWDKDHCRWWRLTPARKNVEDDVGAMDAFGQGLGAGGFDGGQSVAEHGSKNFDHLPIAGIAAGELALYAIQMRRQHPVLERCSIPQSARLARQNRHVMPGIEDRRATSEGARMFGDNASILANDDAPGIGVDFDGAAY